MSSKEFFEIKNKEGFPISFMQEYFSDVQKKFHPVFLKWSVFKYIRYLDAAGLIYFNGDNLKITEKSKALIKYIELRGYAKNKNL